MKPVHTFDCFCCDKIMVREIWSWNMFFFDFTGIFQSCLDSAWGWRALHIHGDCSSTMANWHDGFQQKPEDSSHMFDIRSVSCKGGARVNGIAKKKVGLLMDIAI